MHRDIDRYAYLVELLVELLELGHAAHHVLVHEVGRLQDRVVALAEERDAVVDQRLAHSQETKERSAGATTFRQIDK